MDDFFARVRQMLEPSDRAGSFLSWRDGFDTIKGRRMRVAVVRAR